MAEQTDRDPLLEQTDSKQKENEKEFEDEITQECNCCANVNQNLLPPKLFYFFFFGANGTLMPYLVLFFKQLGLSPSEVGIVTGLKPFISFVFTPIWGYVADQSKRTKWIYILSLIAYLGGYFAYSFAPAKHVCKLRTNSTKHQTPFAFHTHVHRRSNEYNKRDIFDHYFRRKLVSNSESIASKSQKSKKDFIPNTGGINPAFPGELGVSFFQLHVPNKLQPEVVKVQEKKKKTTDDEENNRLLSSFVNATQTALDMNDNSFDLFEPTWGSSLQSHNSPWTICADAKANSEEDINFAQSIKGNANIKAIFSYLLIVTVTATIFSCALITIVDTATIRKLKESNETHKYGKQRLWGSLGWGITSFGVGAIISLIPLCPGMNNEVNYYPAFYVFAILLLIALMIGLKLQFSVQETAIGAGEEVQVSRTRRVIEGLKLMKNPTYCWFMITSFYIGVTMSIIKTFLFWHLKDIGGSQLLFSIIAAINCVAEVFVYYFSSTFIKRVGHIRVLYIALVCYSMRLYYYGLLTNPWYVLAAEPLSGITTAAAWAAMTSYVGLNATPESVTTLQGILHAIHWGLGHGCGELIGGFLVSWIGAAMTFNVFGTLTVIELFMFILVNWLTTNKQTNKMEENRFDDDNKDTNMGNMNTCCK